MFLPHVKLKELSHRILFAERHAVESHVGTDESAEFLGRDFTKALESCYLGICPKLVDGCNTLFISITIIRVIPVDSLPDFFDWRVPARRVVFLLRTRNKGSAARRHGLSLSGRGRIAGCR